MNKLERIAVHYGLRHQFYKTTEELDELKDEIMEALSVNPKYKISPELRTKIIGEIADVEVMLDQLKYLMGIKKEVRKMRKFKINRQIERIKNENL